VLLELTGWETQTGRCMCMRAGVDETMAKKKTPAKGGKAAPKGKGGGKKHAARKPKRSFLRRTAYWLVVLCLWVGIAGAGAGAYIIMSVSDADLYKLPEKERGIIVLAENGEVVASRGAFQGDRVLLDELPIYLSQAVIAIEDRRFHDHFGIDIYGLGRAIVTNLQAGRVVQGGSTISQQLAKNLFLKPDRTFERKMQEAVLALWLEYTYSKDEILQLYLNRVYFGGGAYGVESAAERFFDKSARSVTLAEAAVLAGVLKAPSNYAPTRSRKKAEQRAYLVLNAMVEAGFITAREGQLAVDNPASVAKSPYVPARQYIVDWIAELVPEFAGAQKGNVIVETTINLADQEEAERVVRAQLKAHGKNKRVSQAAVVLMTPTGGIRAMIGGASYARSQYNRAVKARRQPGSAFKPFVYLTALEHGLSPDTVRTDAPFRLGNWRPKNYRNKYYGDVTLRQGLAGSLNSVAARLIVEVGPDEVIKRARRLGIRSPLRNNASIALGTSEVGLIELAGAYAAFANGGLGVLPHIITRITTMEGKVIYQRDGSGVGQVVTERNVHAMNDMLSAVITGGTGKAAALNGHPAAGKSGTSQDFRDAWFVGYTASRVAAVWVGNDDGKSTRDVTGGSLPAAIWHDVMTSAHARLQPAALPGRRDGGEPQNIVDLLKDLSVAAWNDLLGRDTTDAAPRGDDRDIGSVIDEITNNPR